MLPLRFNRSLKTRFLLDENVPLAVAEALGGFGIEWVGRDLPSQSDVKIYQRAVKKQQILITLDKDFANLRLFQKSRPTIILLKFKAQTPVVMARRVQELADSFKSEFTGRLLVLTLEDLLVYP